MTSMSPPPPERNRRIVPRRALRQPATVSYGSTTVAVQTRDVAQDGMCLATSRPIAPGTRCRITFDLPWGDTPTPIIAAARVVYSSYSAPGEFKIGAVFIDLPEDTARELGKFAASA